MQIGYVESLLIGKAVPFARQGILSAINKKPVTKELFVGSLGVDGDEQADLKHHGGCDKAVHFYAIENYEYWRQQIGHLPLLDNAGAFGENIRSCGITEFDICIGDQLKIGSVILEVSQARQPCWKLNERFNVDDMAFQVQDSLRTGWYCRVLENGYLKVNDGIFLMKRPYPLWSLMRIMHIFYHDPLNKKALESLLHLPLVESWHKLITARLIGGAVEDWQMRMNGKINY